MTQEAEEIKNNTTEEIKQILEKQDIQFEESSQAEESPLNQPVAEGEIGITEKQPEKEKATVTETITDKEEKPEPHEENQSDQETEEEPVIDDGVPEQEISASYNETLESELENEEFELPSGHARQAANTFLGITDNLLEVGGGFFVKVRKHKDFYDFEEIVQVIEEHNHKNIQKIKLDEEDKILLRPLLIAILKKKAKKLTPEQQLIGAVLSILIKKVKIAVEIKAENEILIERILEIIREEKGSQTEEDISEEETTDEEPEENKQDEAPEIKTEKKEETGMPASVMEVADENE